MTCLRPFSVDDLFRFNNVNLDPLTETYGLTFYLQYLARWPEYFTVAENPAGEIMGYIMGKAEGHGDLDRPANAQGACKVRVLWMFDVQCACYPCLSGCK